jgi:hypothetical protein
MGHSAKLDLVNQVSRSFTSANKGIEKMIILILFLSPMVFYSQDETFNTIIRESLGDLNEDGLSDQAIISLDTLDDTRPLKLQVLFSLPNGGKKIVFSSTQIIQAMYPIEKNGEHNGSQVPDIYIENGKLKIDFYIKGNSSYDFIYRDGDFELVHFTHVYWDGVNITEIVFNLLTGKYTKQVEVLKTAEVTMRVEKEVLITPLPRLKNFKPFKNELF